MLGGGGLRPCHPQSDSACGRGSHDGRRRGCLGPSSNEIRRAALETRNTYRYYRVEILAALMNAIVLVGISLGVLCEAHRRFSKSAHVQSTLMIASADVDIAHLRETIGKVPGVAGAHDWHIWSLPSGMNAMSAHDIQDHSRRDSDRAAKCDATVSPLPADETIFRQQRPRIVSPTGSPASTSRAGRLVHVSCT